MSSEEIAEVLKGRLTTSYQLQLLINLFHGATTEDSSELGEADDKRRQAEIDAFEAGQAERKGKKLNFHKKVQNTKPNFNADKMPMKNMK